MMSPIQLFDPASFTYTYLLIDQDSRQAIIIDPVDEQIDRDLSVIRQYGVKLVYSIETHAHADHVTSAGKLAEHTGAKTAAPAGCAITTATIQLQHLDELSFGVQTLKALHTPGHTAGSMSFVWGKHVFTGDTLLINGCGRTDFQSGSASDLYKSITQQLFTLSDDTIVWPGHDYQGRTHSSIGHEMQHNQRVAGKSLAQFEAIMLNLNLPKPKRIDEAVPANLTSGLRHDAGGEVVSNDVLSVKAAQGYAGDVLPELAWHWVQSGEARVWRMRSVLPSTSASCYASIHTGVPPQVHGVWGNYAVKKLDLPDVFSELAKAGRRTGAVTHSFWSEFFQRAPFDVVRDIEYDEEAGPIHHGRFHTMTGYGNINQMTPSDHDLFATLTRIRPTLTNPGFCSLCSQCGSSHRLFILSFLINMKNAQAPRAIISNVWDVCNNVANTIPSVEVIPKICKACDTT